MHISAISFHKLGDTVRWIVPGPNLAVTVPPFVEFRGVSFPMLIPLRVAIDETQTLQLLKAMYGLRDAGAAFDRKVLDVMNLMAVSLGKFSICVGYRK